MKKKIRIRQQTFAGFTSFLLLAASSDYAKMYIKLNEPFFEFKRAIFANKMLNASLLFRQHFLTLEFVEQ